MINILPTRKNDPDLQRLMSVHYSQPKGFVGRQLFYRIEYNGVLYGCIAFGSATKHLPGRKLPFHLNTGMSNIFYHVEKQNGAYPKRNFTTYALLEAEKVATIDYEIKYKDKVNWLETLVELPRSGDLYLKAGYTLVGITKGYTCKRIAGESTDKWTGRRVWVHVNLRPKSVFVKLLSALSY